MTSCAAFPQDLLTSPLDVTTATPSRPRRRLGRVGGLDRRRDGLPGGQWIERAVHRSRHSGGSRLWWRWSRCWPPLASGPCTRWGPATARRSWPPLVGSGLCALGGGGRRGQPHAHRPVLAIGLVAVRRGLFPAERISRPRPGGGPGRARPGRGPPRQPGRARRRGVDPGTATRIPTSRPRRTGPPRGRGLERPPDRSRPRSPPEESEGLGRRPRSSTARSSTARNTTTTARNTTRTVPTPPAITITVPSHMATITLTTPTGQPSRGRGWPRWPSRAASSLAHGRRGPSSERCRCTASAMGWRSSALQCWSGGRPGRRGRRHDEGPFCAVRPDGILPSARMAADRLGGADPGRGVLPVLAGDHPARLIRFPLTVRLRRSGFALGRGRRPSWRNTCSSCRTRSRGPRASSSRGLQSPFCHPGPRP